MPEFHLLIASQLVIVFYLCISNHYQEYFPMAASLQFKMHQTLEEQLNNIAKYHISPMIEKLEQEQIRCFHLSEQGIPVILAVSTSSSSSLSEQKSQKVVQIPQGPSKDNPISAIENMFSRYFPAEPISIPNVPVGNVQTSQNTEKWGKKEKEQEEEMEEESEQEEEEADEVVQFELQHKDVRQDLALIDKPLKRSTMRDQAQDLSGQTNIQLQKFGAKSVGPVSGAKRSNFQDPEQAILCQEKGPCVQEVGQYTGVSGTMKQKKKRYHRNDKCGTIFFVN